VMLAGLLAAVKVSGSRLCEQRIVILGAGSSGTGISEQIVAGMKREGLSEDEARSRLCLVDSRGLVHDGREGLEPFKQKYAQPLESLSRWSRIHTGRVCFEEVIHNVHPTVLIGTSAQPLYPPLERVKEVSHKVALEVAVEASRSGLAEKTSSDELERRIKAKTWTPHYLD
ncbi:MAG: malic enzyme-like NAD(P)-binding protein, partial [Pyrinomonadaceae bacterium]